MQNLGVEHATIKAFFFAVGIGLNWMSKATFETNVDSRLFALKVLAFRKIVIIFHI